MNTKEAIDKLERAILRNDPVFPEMRYCIICGKRNIDKKFKAKFDNEFLGFIRKTKINIELE